PGTGPKPAPGQTVTVHCTGFGKGGDISQQFWSLNVFWTLDAGQKPFSFQIGKGAVIKDGMKALSECKLERLLAYGTLK
ncbi:hypothetical protein HID58_047515, partial [Brassica napus]